MSKSIFARTGLSLMFGYALAGAATAAAGLHDSLVVPAIFSENYNRIVSHAFDGMDGDSELRILHYSLPPIALAELDNQLKRQDIKAAVGNATGSIAVLYPDIGEPYRQVFAKIIEGIEEMAKVKVRSFAISASADAGELNSQLKRNDIKVVIALGRQGLKAASGLDRDIAVVVGGVLAAPEVESRLLTGVSLTPDPSLLFTRLKELQPNVKRVFVVYNPNQNEWLIKLARDAARARGLELVAQEARDLASAAHLYEGIFAAADSRRDVVWLPQDATTVDENTILPLVLKESWGRNVTVFSSSYLHVKKGVLFALYPNNVELGRTLASSALGVLSGEPRAKGMAPLREVHTAVNLRTANHIGININYQQQRSFETVFPEP